jgi:hypothetical protein
MEDEMSENPIQPVTPLPPAPVEPVPAQVVPVEPEYEKTSFGNEMLWLAMGAVMPCGSFTFYKKAARRKKRYALLFFFLFSLVLAVLTSAMFSRGINMAMVEMEKGLATTALPEITIRDGIATAKGPQPFVLYGGDRTLFAIDTTGKINEIDPALYDTGLLMTRTELHLLQSSGQEQRMTLLELQQAFNANPLVINKENLIKWATAALGFAKVGAFVGILLWDLFGRLVMILLAGLLFWGIASLIKQGAPFAPILITGIYSYVPAVYVNFVLGQAKAQFPFALTLVHTLIWLVALLFVFEVLGKNLLTRERTLRSWRTWIGIPMLVLMALQYVLVWETGTAWSVLAWGLTLLVLAGIGVQGLWNAQVAQT